MLRLIVPLSTLVVGFLLVTSGPEAGEKKKKAGKVNGTILKVEAGKDETTLMIKTAAKKKKGEVVEEGKEQKVRVTKETLVEKAGENKKDPAVAGTVADLRADQKVTVTLNPTIADVAERVLIHAAKKKKKDE